MRNDKLPDDLVLSEEQVREVINRAAREVPASSGITVAELRQIAAELDIDPKSLERAFDAVIGLPVPDQPLRTWFRRQVTKLGRVLDAFLPKKGRLIAGALFGGLAGWLNALLPMDFSIQTHYPVAAAMIGITLANLLSRRLDRAFARFVAETLVTWGAYALLWASTFGGVTTNLLIWVFFWVSAAMLLGWLLIGGRPGDGDYRLSHPVADAASPDVADDPGTTLRRSVNRNRLMWLTFLRLARA